MLRRAPRPLLTVAALATLRSNSLRATQNDIFGGKARAQRRRDGRWVLARRGRRKPTAHRSERK